MDTEYIKCTIDDVRVGDFAGDYNTGIAGAVTDVVHLENGLIEVWFKVEEGHEDLELEVAYFSGFDGFYRSPRDGE